MDELRKRSTQERLKAMDLPSRTSSTSGLSSMERLQGLSIGSGRTSSSTSASDIRTDREKTKEPSATASLLERLKAANSARDISRREEASSKDTTPREGGFGSRMKSLLAETNTTQSKLSESRLDGPRSSLLSTNRDSPSNSLSSLRRAGTYSAPDSFKSLKQRVEEERETRTQETASLSSFPATSTKSGASTPDRPLILGGLYRSATSSTIGVAEDGESAGPSSPLVSARPSVEPGRLQSLLMQKINRQPPEQSESQTEAVVDQEKPKSAAEEAEPKVAAAESQALEESEQPWHAFLILPWTCCVHRGPEEYNPDSPEKQPLFPKQHQL